LLRDTVLSANFDQIVMRHGSTLGGTSNIETGSNVWGGLGPNGERQMIITLDPRDEKRYTAVLKKDGSVGYELLKRDMILGHELAHARHRMKTAGTLNFFGMGPPAYVEHPNRDGTREPRRTFLEEVKIIGTGVRYGSCNSYMVCKYTTYKSPKSMITENDLRRERGYNLRITHHVAN